MKKKYGVTTNVVNDADTQKREYFEAKALTLEQLNILLSEALKEEDKSMLCAIGLAAIGVLRRGEILGLKYKHIFTNKKYIHIIDNRVQLGSSEVTKLPKDNETREVGLPDPLKNIIELELSTGKTVRKRHQSRGLYLSH